ncbi:MAG: M4 family metallopeptidase [Flavobacteriaceae bacterium]|nr:M4 family metallopeptidase [Flavobacteriaceae bacterium]
MKKITLTILCFLLIGGFSFAQNIQKSIEELSAKTEAKVTLSKNSGTAEFIKFPKNAPLELAGTTINDKVITFLENNKGIYNLKRINETLKFDETKTDPYGFKRVELKQVYNNVPVYDGKLIFHFNREDKLTAVNGNYLPVIKLNPIPKISRAEAANLAIRAIENQELNKSGGILLTKENTLYIFQKGLVQGYRGTSHLVYRIEVTNGIDVREFVFIDAHSGKVIEQFTGIAHALDRIIYEGDLDTVVWEEGDPFPGALTQWQQNEVVTSEHVYNFFNNAFGFVSYDNADAQMVTINNVDIPNFCPNAAWNGSYVFYCDGLATDDVIGHEWGHAYTEYTSGLIYAWQSGAINESYSDIWGETIDLINNYEDGDDDVSLRTDCASSDRWVLGEDINGGSTGIRDMWNPNCKNDPGKVTDAIYWCSRDDNGGVHINSGIPNKAYALLVDGGTYNGQTITGIGLTKAAHIFWRVQRQYLTASSDFVSFADALEAACTDLIGLNLEELSTAGPAGASGKIITQEDYNQLVKTILAVELRVVPECYGPLLLPLANELCDASVSNPLFFEDWESGMGNWTVEQEPVNASTWESRDWEIFNGPLFDRTGKFALATNPANGDCVTDLQNGIISMISPVINFPNAIILPGQPPIVYEMAFNHLISIENDWDGANIKYSLNGGSWKLLPRSAFTENPYNDTDLIASDNPLTGEPAFTGGPLGGGDPSWGTSVIDLSQIGVAPNTTIQFSFELGSDGCNGWGGWVLDEIMVYNCADTLSSSEFNIENALNVFPNPSNGIFTIEKVSSINLRKGTIYDINGRIIKVVDLNSFSKQMNIDLSSVELGMYFMSIESDNSKHVIKLLKQ